MQRLFAEATDWSVPSFSDILPAVLTLAQAHPIQTVYTRFLTPSSANAAPGDWQNFYTRWPGMTRDRLHAGLFDLVEPLAGMAPPEEMYDKTVYSAFSNAGFVASLSRRHATTLVLTGVETDVCILATAFDAVDRGLHVVVVADAVTSWSPAGHRAALEAIYPRFDQQIEITTANDVLALWPKD